MSDFIINTETRNKLDEARFTLATSSADATDSTDKVLLSLSLELGNILSKCVITPLTAREDESETDPLEELLGDFGQLAGATDRQSILDQIGNLVSGTGSSEGSTGVTP